MRLEEHTNSKQVLPREASTPGKPSLARGGATRASKRRQALERAGRLSLDTTSTGEPTLSLHAEGHGGGPKNVDLDFPFSSGSWSSARTEMPLAREPGDLGGASLRMVRGRQSREGSLPHAVAHASEESDEVIRPKKLAKTWVTPVESMEERTEAEGNAAVGNASPTQGGTDALTTLQRLRQRAKRRSTERFTNLLCMIKVPLLREAYQNLRKDAASGVDKVTWKEYGTDLETRLPDLQDRIHRGSYHPQPVRRVYIDKTGQPGKKRPLGIPSLEDKIVQQAARMVLEPIYESEFIGFSYGFRPGRSQHKALDALAECMERKVNWVLDADIRAFFDTISHGWMQIFLEHRIADRRMVRLLMKFLHAGVVEEGEFKEVEEGTPQGGIISPLMANIYLHYALDLWVQNWRKTRAHGEVYIVRYADDFVMGFQREEDANTMRSQLSERLAKFGLELHPDKTRILQFGRFAGKDRERDGLGKPESFDFLGFTHICARDRRGRFQLLRLTSRKKRKAKLASLKEEMCKRRHWPVENQWKWLRSVLIGHDRYYGVPNNYKTLRQFHWQVENAWLRSLQRRSQRATWTVRKIRSFLERYPLPLPAIHHPWPQQRFATR